MGEQIITEKQYKALKTTNGFLLAVFIIFIITGAMSFMGILVAVAMKPQEAGTLVSLIQMAVEIALVSLLLFYKHQERKTVIAIGMLVNAIAFTAISVYSLFIITPAYGTIYSSYGLQNAFTDGSGSAMLLYNTGCILYVASSAIVILLSVLLLRKTRAQAVGAFPFKLLFILFAAFQFAYIYLTMFALIPTNISFYMALMITVCITAGLIGALTLVPQFVLYKALDDEAYYENFIAVHPGIAIRNYEAAKFGYPAPPAAPGENRFCVNCGAALAPGSNFCRKCGNRVNAKAENKGDE